jgi:hypothetical protein
MKKTKFSEETLFEDYFQECFFHNCTYEKIEMSGYLLFIKPKKVLLMSKILSKILIKLLKISRKETCFLKNF